MSEEVSKFITIIRPEFMSFCKDACRSATLNHLLFRLAGKCKDQPKEKIQAGKILWYGSNELITGEMSNAWGVCKVRQETNELVKMGLFGRTSNPEWGVDRTKHFFFGTEQCATFLKLCDEQKICFVHMDLPDEVKHLIYSSNANDKSIKCICAIHQMQVIDISDAFDTSIKAIYKEDYKEDYKDNNIEDNKEREEVADATAPAASHSEEGYEDEEETQKREAFMGMVRGLVAQANEKAVKVPASKKPASKPSNIQNALPDNVIAILDKWDKIHKKPIPRTPKAIQAAQLLTVCDPSAEDLKKCESWLYTTDRPGKPWYRSHGVHLPDIAENIGKWQSLQEAPPQKSDSNGHSPESNGTKPRPSALVSEEQAQKNKDRLYALAAAKQAEKAGGK